MSQPTFRCTNVYYMDGSLRAVEVQAVRVGADSSIEPQLSRSLNILRAVLDRGVRGAVLQERTRLGLGRISRAALGHRIRGLMHIVNVNNNQGRVANWEQGQIIALDAITVEWLLEIIEMLSESGADFATSDLVWTFYIDERTFQEGAAPHPLTAPKWSRGRYAQCTWEGQGVNCAAFALAYAMASRPQRRSLPQLRLRAAALARECGWAGEPTTSTFELGAFVEQHPAYRVICVIPHARCLRDYTFTGADYVAPVAEGADEHLIIMAWSPETNHYGLVEGATNAYKRILNSQSIRFCHECLTLHEQDKVCRCGGAEAPPPRKRKVKCAACGMHGCTQGCEAKCSMCNAFKGAAHRCIVYAKPSEPERFWMPGDEEVIADDANAQEPDGSHSATTPYKLYAYDIESAIVREESVEDTLSFGVTPDGSAFTLNVEGGVRTYKVAKAHHTPVMVVYRNVFDPDSERILTGPHCLRDFIQLMLNTNAGRNICIAHNGAGYDSRLIAEVATQLGGAVRVGVVPRGCKFMRLSVGKTVFGDSLLHLPGSLASLAAGYFGGEGGVAKGYFPHLFNCEANRGYRGPIPAKRYFDLAFMIKSAEGRAAFDEWYDGWRGDWDFDAELLKYCRNDVDILARLIVRYHELCVQKFDISPWFSTTGPSYVHKAIKRQLSLALELPDPSEREEYREAIRRAAWESHWGVLVSNEYWFARAALRGGRTDVRTLLHTVTPGEWERGVRIRYQDIVSMYPYVQIARDYPVGLPTIEIYTRDLYPCYVHRNPAHGANYIAPVCGCEYDVKVRRRDRRLDIVEKVAPDAAAILADDSFFGIVCASLTPPTRLFHPVLVTWDEDAGKCIGSLRPIRHGVFTTPEFKLALARGYRLDTLHRLDRYRAAPGLWNDFIKSLYIDKMAASEEAPDAAGRDALVAQYSAEPFCMGDEVRASFARWGNHPAQRQVAKTLCNCGWGKHCEQCNKDSITFIGEEDRDDMGLLFDNVRDGNVRIKDLRIVGSRTMVRSGGTGVCEPSFHGGYLPAGLFVPAWGRLMLYEQLERLDLRVLYHDTDSIIYIYDPLLYNIPVSDVWGGWSVEKFDTKNGGLREFVALGPKSYGVRAANGASFIKVKGLSLRLAHEPLLNFDVMKGMVETWRDSRLTPHIGIPQFTFEYVMGRGIATIHQLKRFMFQPSMLKGVVRGLTLYPFGHEEDY